MVLLLRRMFFGLLGRYVWKQVRRRYLRRDGSRPAPARALHRPPDLPLTMRG